MPGDTVSFVCRPADLPGAVHTNLWEAELVIDGTTHAGWIRQYDLKRFFERRKLEKLIGRHIRGRILTTGDEFDWPVGGGRCTPGRFIVEIVPKEDIQTTDGESSGEDLPLHQPGGHNSL